MEKKCKFCNNVFEHKTKSKKYCTIKCRKSAELIRSSEKYKKRAETYFKNNREKLRIKSHLYRKNFSFKYKYSKAKSYFNKLEDFSYPQKYLKKINDKDCSEKTYSKNFCTHYHKIIMESKGNKCEICGNNSRLHIHHKDYSWEFGKDTYDSILKNKDKLCLLCNTCHCKIHQQINRINKSIMFFFYETFS